jgi:hypothetical protein
MKTCPGSLNHQSTKEVIGTMNRYRTHVSLILVCGMMLFVTGTLYAIPKMINYQGLLMDNGTPVQGTKTVQFRIYDSAEGGTSLWEEPQSVTFSDGVFSVLLGSTETLPETVFDGSRRWLSVSIEGGPEIQPRGEIVSVGYAYHAASAYSAVKADSADLASEADLAAQAVDAGRLDGYDSSDFAGATHTHDSRYYTQTQLKTSDGTPPNQGSNLVHWNTLNGVPSGFADGIDNTGESQITDHGELTGLLDDDHPQYAMKDSLKTSDGNPPNQGKNLVHWNILTGVPNGFADGTDNITTDASAITSGVMDPERIDGTAVVDNDPRILTVSQKDALTGGGTTSLHSHIETGDISSVTAGQGLSGGGTVGSITVSHAEDASTLPFAHHYPPIVMSTDTTMFEGDSTEPEIVDSLSFTAPAEGYVFISFSATQLLDIDQEGIPPEVVARRYIASYGVSVDDEEAFDYSVSSSMLDSLFWVAGTYRPMKAVAGTTVQPVTEGVHTVYFLTSMITEIDPGADNILEDISLTALYVAYDDQIFQTALLSSRGGQQSHRSSRPPVDR